MHGDSNKTMKNIKDIDKQMKLEISTAIVHSSPLSCSTTFKLFHGDCLEVMQGIPSKSIDTLITDPPFAFTGGMSNGRSSEIDSQFFEHWWHAVCEQITRILKPTSEGFIWCDWRTAHAIANGFKPREQTYSHFRIAQMLFHYREMPGQGQPFRNSVDMIAYLRGPKSKGNRIANTTHNWISKYWYYGKHKNHPAEKDPAITRQLIKWSTDKGNTVIDPFMGSGTTGVAAICEGCNFVGIEKTLHHYETAKARIEASQAQKTINEEL